MLKKGEIAIIIFNLLYVLAFTIYYLSIGNFEFMIYIGVLVLVGFIVIFNLRKSGLDYLALWGLSIWGFLHMVGGGVKIAGQTVYRLKLFNIIDNGGDFFILKMDQVIHFYGFAVAAIVIYQLIAPRFKDVLQGKKLPIFIAWIGSMGLGALNEIVEFIAFISLEKTGVGDLYNTGLDLIFNLLGAFVGSIVAYRWHKRKTTNMTKLKSV